MIWKTFFSILVTVFFAEIGDKTQLATMLYATDAKVNKWLVFAAASMALVLAAGLGVLVGAQLERFATPKTLRLLAGIGFVAIGVWTLTSR